MSKQIPVIVRAWGGEPVAMTIYSTDNKAAYVGRIEGRRTIGLRFTDVFAFDEHTFSQLSTAYKQGSLEEMDKIYASLDDFSCKRYQDTLSSLHEEESISDSGGTADSGQQ